jgi:hypothetical protein
MMTLRRPLRIKPNPRLQPELAKERSGSISSHSFFASADAANVEGPGSTGESGFMSVSPEVNFRSFRLCKSRGWVKNKHQEKHSERNFHEVHPFFML